MVELRNRVRGGGGRVNTHKKKPRKAGWRTERQKKGRADGRNELKNYKGLGELKNYKERADDTASLVESLALHAG